DSDGDGINDEIDLCPNQKETYNKYNDDDGCPDIAPEQSRYKHDADLDGIIDDYDLCPLEPEDYDGDRDTDGCPDP
ncbi:MAG: thrombospondin, partial [Thaumarchaeota archaeon]|nr:thrombospondin [Nitrososphaerota archaeon]